MVTDHGDAGKDLSLDLVDGSDEEVGVGEGLGSGEFEGLEARLRGGGRWLLCRGCGRMSGCRNGRGVARDQR